MYCSENCRNEDWSSSVHSHMCGNMKLHHFNAGTDSKPQYLPEATFLELLMRLIDFIGLETIKTTVLENKPMMSLLGDKRTKGFAGGKFEAVTLEALLSLECNIDKVSGRDILQHSIVRIVFHSAISEELVII
jgi:hypothetical protein